MSLTNLGTVSPDIFPRRMALKPNLLGLEESKGFSPLQN